MESYKFESIHHQDDIPIKLFFASIDHATYHWHYDYEIVFVVEGSIDIQTSKKALTRYAKGEFLLINSRDTHMLKSSHENNLCFIIQFHPSILSDSPNKLIHFNLDSQSEKFTPNQSWDYFRERIANIGFQNYLNTSISRNVKLKAAIYSFIADLLDYTLFHTTQISNQGNSDENQEMLVSIMNYIEENAHQHISVTDIGKHVGMNDQAVYRFMKRNTKMTITDLIRIFRIEMAKKLLKTTDKSLAYIAQESGYNSEMAFYRAFKKETGTTPKDFKMNGVQQHTDREIQGYLQFDLEKACASLIQYMNS